MVTAIFVFLYTILFFFFLKKQLTVPPNKFFYMPKSWSVKCETATTFAWRITIVVVLLTWFAQGMRIDDNQYLALGMVFTQGYL